MQQFDPFFSAIALLSTSVGIIFAALVWVLKNRQLVFRPLPMPPVQLVGFGIVFGITAGVVGGIPYIWQLQDPGVVDWSTSAEWLARHDPQSLVKFFRLIWFSAVIGMALSLLLTMVTALGFHFSLSEKNNSDIAAFTGILTLLIVAIAVCALYVGSHFSDIGKFYAGLRRQILDSVLEGMGLANPDKGRPLFGVTFGAGVCQDLEEYDLQIRDTNSGNTICDVGPIRGINIIFLVGLFVMLWASLFYWSAMGVVDRHNLSLRKRLLTRSGMWAACSILASLTFAWIMEPWSDLEMANGRNLIVNSRISLVGAAAAVSLICLIIVLLVVRDIRTGTVTSSAQKKIC